MKVEASSKMTPTPYLEKNENESLQLLQHTFIYKVLREQNIQKLWAVSLW
jgi:hypothetical protein